jgi:hypothetical protein
MIRDGKEHICSGCFQVIASHDPEAYRRGEFYYHSAYHEVMHRSREQRPRIDERQERSQEEFVVVPLALD